MIYDLGAVGGQIVVSGSLIASDISVYANSSITFYGSDFAINGVSVTGTFGALPDGSERYGTLPGTLANGDTLNNGISINDNAQLTLVAEPATLLLFGLVAVMLRRKR